MCHADCKLVSGVFFPKNVFKASFRDDGWVMTNDGTTWTQLGWDPVEFAYFQHLRCLSYTWFYSGYAQFHYEQMLYHFGWNSSRLQSVNAIDLFHFESGSQQVDTNLAAHEVQQAQLGRNKSSDSLADTSSNVSQSTVTTTPENSKKASPEPSKAGSATTIKETVSPITEATDDDARLFAELEELYEEFKSSFSSSSTSTSNKATTLEEPTPQSNAIAENVPVPRGWLYSNELFTIPENDGELQNDGALVTKQLESTDAPPLLKYRYRNLSDRIAASTAVPKSSSFSSYLREQAASHTVVSPTKGVSRTEESSHNTPAMNRPKHHGPTMAAAAVLASLPESFPQFTQKPAQRPTFLPGDFAGYKALVYPKDHAAYFPADFFKYRELCSWKERESFLPGDFFHLYAANSKRKRRLRLAAKKKNPKAHALPAPAKGNKEKPVKRKPAGRQPGKRRGSGRPLESIYAL